jgi:hypothetical protein
MFKFPEEISIKVNGIICPKFAPAAFLMFVITLCNSALAQNSTSTPYSRFGVGDLSSNTLARNLALGGTEIGLDQPNNINFGNPAAYSGLWYTTYEAGFDFKQFELETSYSSYQSNTASVSYFNFAFPIKVKKWSVGFGLLPYSKVGYKATSVTTTPFGDTETAQYEGSGGLNSFHIGTGVNLFKGLSLGVNAEYIFGVLNYDRTIAFNTPYYLNTATYSSNSVGWFHFKGGAQYRFDSLAISKSDSVKLYENRIEILTASLAGTLSGNIGDTSQESYARINKIKQEIAESQLLLDNVKFKKAKTDFHLVLGLVVAPTADLHASNSSTINSFRYRYYQNPGLGVIIRDTVVNVEGEDSYIRLPLQTGFGFSLLKGTKWLFCADYTRQDWSNFSFMGQPDSLIDSWKVTAGIQFTPNDRATKAYGKTIQYRVGFHYDNGYLNLNGHNITDIGLSAGVGLPIRKAGTLIHLTLEGGNRGTTKDNLVLEKYIKITLGFTINDRWFIKQKYD